VRDLPLVSLRWTTVIVSEPIPEAHLQSALVRQLLPSQIHPSPTVFAESAQTLISRQCPDPAAGISDD
jgi:hypothetical protein